MATKLIIQIIEPDNYLAGIYGRKFEAEGWKVLIAENFEEAEKQRLKVKVSAIILEPDIDIKAAENVLKSLRKDPATATIPLLIFSTIAEKAEIAKMKKAGANAYLLKGHFVPSEVVRKVKSMLL